MNSHAWTTVAFAVVLLSTFVVDQLARREGSRMPTFSELCAYIMRWWPGRVAVIFFWWWLGWHFLAR